jgi:hypothetical protein
MGFHINPKIAAKSKTATAKSNTQGGSSKFIAKPTSTKSSGATKKPVKTGGSRGS